MQRSMFSQSSNPVLTHLDDVARESRRSRDLLAPAERRMTVDDVAIRTVGLLALTGLTGAIAWTTLRSTGLVIVAVVGSVVAGLVLALVIAIKQITNPYLIGGYAALQGVLLGVVSRQFEAWYPGIVIQAVVGTFAVFLGMAALYRFRILRATPKFRRWVVGALFGVVALSLVNLLAYLFTGRQGIEVYSPTGAVNWVPILFSVACVGVGALTLILDFDAVEEGVRYELPERYAWYCAFGLLVGLIYLYWQILRLLSYVRR